MGQMSAQHRHAAESQRRPPPVVLDAFCSIAALNGSLMSCDPSSNLN